MRRQRASPRERLTDALQTREQTSHTGEREEPEPYLASCTAAEYLGLLSLASTRTSFFSRLCVCVHVGVFVRTHEQIACIHLKHFKAEGPGFKAGG